MSVYYSSVEISWTCRGCDSCELAHISVRSVTVVLPHFSQLETLLLYQHETDVGLNDCMYCSHVLSWVYWTVSLIRHFIVQSEGVVILLIGVMQCGWFSHWSRREEADFYRVVSTFGVERDWRTTEFRWAKFRALARLDKKHDDTLTEYFRAFYHMCLTVCRRVSSDDNSKWPAVVHINRISVYLRSCFTFNKFKHLFCTLSQYGQPV